MAKKTKKETTELVPIPDAVVVQLPTPEQGATAVRNYTELKNMLDKELEDCVVMVNTRNGQKPFRKKTYWRAIGNCFKLSYEIIRDERIELDGDWGYEVTVRATDLEGRFSDGDGSCFASEKIGLASKVHDVRAHAKTRATNRAIADLVAFGEVTYEEVSEYKPPTQNASQESVIETHKADMNDVFKQDKPVKPKKTLEDHDAPETVNEVVAKYTMQNGTTVYHIDTSVRKYTCLNEDVRQLAEKALAEGLAINPTWRQGTTKPKGDKPGRNYNAMSEIELIYE